MPGVGVAKAVSFNKKAIWGSPESGTTSHITLPDNATTGVDLGSALVVESIIISYSATRGSDRQYGEIVILSPYTDVVETPPYHMWDFDDIGMTCTASLNAGQIRLNFVVDSSSANDIDFDYLIEKITSLTKIHS